MALRPDDASAAPDRTTDLPAPPHAPDTARRADTSVRTAPAAGDTRTVAPTGIDGSAVTGGYTPAEPVARPAGPVAVAGYEILGELGRGGMGIVFKARQVALDRVVALKMILAGPHATPTVLARFRAEALAVARLQHPSIVQVFEVGEAARLPYLSLEFVDGGSLSKKVAHEPQPPGYAAETVRALARAMAYAHERGVIHRDLKPANVLLAADGTPKITDFGLAKRLEGDSLQTQAGAVLGTPSYMAPEQASGETDRIGPLVDVYALGAVLYDLLTGRPPFAGTTVLDTLEMVRTREPVPPGQLAGKLPRDLETITLKCLQKDPARRYASAGALADDLGRFLEGKPIVARPVSAAERAWRWAKRNRWVAGLGSAVALLLVTVAVVTSVLSWRLNVKRNEAEANAESARIAQAKEAAAREVSDKTADMLMDNIREFAFFVDRELQGKRSLAPLRLKIQESALKAVEKLRQYIGEHPLGGRTEGLAHQRMGDVYLLTRSVQDAADEYRKGHAILAELARQNPRDPVAKHNLAALTNLLGDAELRLGDAASARDRYAAALKLRQQRLELELDNPDARRSVATSHRLLGGVSLVLGEPAAALEHYRACREEYAKLRPNVAGSAQVRYELAAVRDRVGEALFRLRKPKEAEAEYQAAFREREELLQRSPRAPGLIRALAHSRITLGDHYLIAQGDPVLASVEYAAALGVFQARAKADPENLEAQEDTAAAHYRLGVTAERLGRLFPPVAAWFGPVVSGHHYAECLRLRAELAKADPKDTHGQVDLLVAQARAGRTAEAEQTADGLLKQAPKDRRVLFQVACGLAVAGSGSDPVAARCRDRAFEVLGDLIKAGWKDRVALETDPDLEAVRGDPRFKELVAGTGR
ncbi:MAG TPA: protein kinase [Gemmataceae bacterium]|nr:protein kinase [Gemmataceae bacterium]